MKEKTKHGSGKPTTNSCKFPPPPPPIQPQPTRRKRKRNIAQATTLISDSFRSFPFYTIRWIFFYSQSQQWWWLSVFPVIAAVSLNCTFLCPSNRVSTVPQFRVSTSASPIQSHSSRSLCWRPTFPPDSNRFAVETNSSNFSLLATSIFFHPLWFPYRRQQCQWDTPGTEIGKISNTGPSSWERSAHPKAFVIHMHTF